MPDHTPAEKAKNVRIKRINESGQRLNTKRLDNPKRNK